MYRFLATPRWLGLAALMMAAAAVMVALGNWQLDRYRERAAVNDRIERSATVRPLPVTDVLPPDAAPGAGDEYARVNATGRYDRTHEILVRGRTLDGRVGYEVLTPLRLADGSAVLVDRGWVPPAKGGALVAPQVPEPPGGDVSVTGLVRLPERGSGAPVRRDGHLEVRGIDPARIASTLPYPLRGGYLTVDSDQPGLTPVPPVGRRAWQNAGYAVQWWAFAALTLVGYAYLARREARGIARPERVKTRAVF